MRDSEQEPSPGPSTVVTVFTALFFAAILLSSLGFAFFGVAAYLDSPNREADRHWGIAALVGRAVFFLASVAGILSLIVRNKALWVVAAVLVGLSLIAAIAMGVLGVGMIADSQRRGGDWGAAAVVGSTVFGLICPALGGLLTIGGGVFLLLARPRR